MEEDIVLDALKTYRTTTSDEKKAEDLEMLESDTYDPQGTPLKTNKDFIRRKLLLMQNLSDAITALQKVQQKIMYAIPCENEDFAEASVPFHNFAVHFQQYNNYLRDIAEKNTNMPTEHLVSFLQAQVLAGLGFSEPVNHVYNEQGLIFHCISDTYDNYNKSSDSTVISAPTLNQTVDWLRNQFNIIVQSIYASNNHFKAVLAFVDSSGEETTTELMNGPENGLFTVYEDALIDAINNALHILAEL